MSEAEFEALRRELQDLRARLGGLVEGVGGQLSNDSHDGYSEYGERDSDPLLPAGLGVRLFSKNKSGASELYYLNKTGVVRDLSTAGSGAPAAAEYVVETAHADLSAEVVLGTTVVSTAAYASRQAAAKGGRLFLPSDGFQIERDTGGAAFWAPWGPIFPLTAPPAVNNFTWVNQGTSTTDTTKGGIFLDGQASGGAGHNIRALVKSKTAPYTITAGFLPLLQPLAYSHAGLCFRQSSDGKLATIALLWNSQWYIYVSKYTNPTTLSANYALPAYSPIGPLVWFRIADDSTNRICSISVDGQNWMVLHTIGRTDFLTADQVGFYVNGQFVSGKAAMTLVHWVET